MLTMTITGQTYELRFYLRKDLGYTWNPEDKSWSKRYSQRSIALQERETILDKAEKKGLRVFADIED